MSVYVSVSALALVNVEALNAVETLGNIVRHRKVQLIIPRNGRLQLVTVPAISGESLRHCYQATLAEIAQKMGINVCDYCSLHEFIKHGIETIVSERDKSLHSILTDNKKSLAEKEHEIIKRCVVEDVGGFLIPYAKPMPLKRTSRLQVSYMIPAIFFSDEGITSTLYTEQQVRHAPKAQQELREKGIREELAQSIYYVETGSALYTFNLVLDAGSIGKPSICDVGTEECEKRFTLPIDERKRRVKAAILALYNLFAGLCGAKRSSFMPHWETVAVVAVVSKPTVILPVPAHSKEFILETVELAERIGKLYDNIIETKHRVLYYMSPRVKGLVKEPRNSAKQHLEKVVSIEDLLKKIIDTVDNWLSEGS